MEFDLNSLLNAKTKAAAPTAQEEAQEEFKIELIDIEDLMPSNDNFYDMLQIKELAEAIKLTGGVMQNLIVKPKAHGKHEIIAGHRRRMACMQLLKEGKEQYRKVPCKIETEEEQIKDRLTLILTNATARQLSDWEKVEQTKKLKQILTDYKEQIETDIKKSIKEGEYCKGCNYIDQNGACSCEKMSDEEKEKRVQESGNGCEYYERKRLGRIREIVAQMLNTSTTQIGRMESIDNNLSDDFKQEMKAGNINISTAHELSKLDEEAQGKAFETYKDKGEIHIKDVKESAQEEQQEPEEEKQPEEQPKEELQESFMNLPEEVQQEPEEEDEPGEIEEYLQESGVNENCEGQMKVSDYKEILPDVKEKGLRFTQWVNRRYGSSQYEQIREVVRNTIAQQLKQDGEINPKEWEERIANSLSVWVMDKTNEYKEYLNM